MKTLRGYFFVILLLILAMSCSISSPNNPPDVITEETSNPPEQSQPTETIKSISVEFVSLWNVEGGPNEAHAVNHFTMDPDGNLVFVETGKNLQHPSVFKFDTTGKFLTQWGDLGAGEGKFSSPTNVAVDGQGNIYVTDTYVYPNQFPVQKFDKDGNFLASFGSFSDDNALEWTGGIAVDDTGNVYAIDMSNKILKFDSAGNLLTSWSAQGAEGDRVQYFDLAIDQQGNLYEFVTDDDYRIIKFDNNGQVLSTWEKPLCGSDYFSINGYGSIWVDSQGFIYITNEFSNGICVFDGNGTFVTNFRLQDAHEGQYNKPIDVVGDNSGNIYVLEGLSDGYRVQIFKAK